MRVKFWGRILCPQNLSISRVRGIFPEGSCHYDLIFWRKRVCSRRKSKHWGIWICCFPNLIVGAMGLGLPGKGASAGNCTKGC